MISQARYWFIRLKLFGRRSKEREGGSKGTTETVQKRFEEEKGRVVYREKKGSGRRPDELRFLLQTRRQKIKNQKLDRPILCTHKSHNGHMHALEKATMAIKWNELCHEYPAVA